MYHKFIVFFKHAIDDSIYMKPVAYLLGVYGICHAS